MKMKIAALLITVFLCSGFAGPTEIECNITVRGEDSLSLKNVKILVIGTAIQAYTDEEGRVTFPCSVGDIYVAAAPGYKSVVDTVTNSTIEVWMEKDSPKKVKKSRKNKK